MSSDITARELREYLADCDDDSKIHLHASGAFKECRNMNETEITWNTGEKETVVELR